MPKSSPARNSRRQATLRGLPAVSSVLGSPRGAAAIRRHGRPLCTALAREVLQALRQRLLQGEPGLGRELSPAAVVAAIESQAAALLTRRPRRVINATGVVVHTNLGRAPLSAAAAQAVALAATGYVDLEYDLERGERGRRLGHLEPLLARLFPGQACALFNNNAAATLVCLRALARGREVLVSRGELVEIGGSFRVPDILAASGAKLREVGTTNRTRAGDYAAAAGPRTGAILKVHPSNFRIVGFTEEPALEALAAVARRLSIPLIVDWGSGDLVDLGPLGLHDEVPVGRLLERGADLVTFSGDKLLGGPQAGFVVGRRELVERVRRDPLARACRLDRLLVAAMWETLATYVRDRATSELPTLRMLGLPAAEIGRRAERLKRALERKLRRAAGVRLEIVDGVSRTGGGSSPAGERPTRLLAIGLDTGDAAGLERKLRAHEPPVIARLHDGRLLLDLRTVQPEEEAALLAALAAALRPRSGS